MSRSSALIADCYQRAGLPHAHTIDDVYGMQVSYLRELITRLDVIMEDEGVDDTTATRIIRCLLYGAPSEAEALHRFAEQERMVDLLANRPRPLYVPAADVQRLKDAGITF